MEDRVVTVKEACRHIRCGRSKLYVLAKEGKVKLIKLGRRKTLVDLASLHQLLQQAAT